MLYTGVHDTLVAGTHQYIQRIGVATSTDLNIWTQDSTWIYSPSHTSWADLDSLSYSGQQFRDPFVMADPDSAGHYLMFFGAVSKYRKPRMVVGVARTHGPNADFRSWDDVGPLWNTDLVHTGANVVESPHAFLDHAGRWWLYYTGALNYGDSALVCFETNDVNPVDPDTTRWSTPDSLFRFIGGDQTVEQWHASEYLRVASPYEYLAAYDDIEYSVSLAEMSWHGPHIFALNDSCPPYNPLAVDERHSRPQFSLELLGAHPARGWASFGVEVPARMYVRLAIFDVLGRRVRILLEGEVPAGRRIALWDGKGDGGGVGSGVYFARLTSVSGQRVAKVVLIR
jgi:hypothetical protein